MIKNVYASQLNKNLSSDYYNTLVSEDSISTDLDAVCEWAARVCYQSQSKYGSSENFISGIIKSEHFDVLEHSIIGFEIEYDYEDDPTPFTESILYAAAYGFQKRYPYCKFHITTEDDKLYVDIAASLRVWYEIIVWGKGAILEALLDNANAANYGDDPDRDINAIRYILYMFADKTFAEISGNVMINMREVSSKHFDSLKHWQNLVIDSLNRKINFPLEESENVAVLSAFIFPPVPQFNNICFEVKDVSRAFTHQHVRHRKLSFSQESQRYVDLEKGGTDNLFVQYAQTDEQKEILDKFEKYTQRAYRSLRKSGMRKEDARQVLPNMTKTRIVTSGFADGVEHYLKLRTAKDAQHEIRKVAKQVETAYNTITLNIPTEEK